MTYAFGLCRIENYERLGERYELLGTVEVGVRVDAELVARMRPWAMATLAAAGYGFGLYHVTLAEVDEDGELGRCVESAEIAWSGEAELVPLAAVNGG